MRARCPAPASVGAHPATRSLRPAVVATAGTARNPCSRADRNAGRAPGKSRIARWSSFSLVQPSLGRVALSGLGCGQWCHRSRLPVGQPLPPRLLDSRSEHLQWLPAVLGLPPVEWLGQKLKRERLIRAYPDSRNHAPRLYHRGGPADSKLSEACRGAVASRQSVNPPKILFSKSPHLPASLLIRCPFVRRLQPCRGV
jgi:hypothetical protein